MSKVTKRKYVEKEVLNDYVLPEEHQQIVRIVGGRGNNLHLVETATKEQFLVSMPNKFRKNVWIKRGDYVIVDPIGEGDKVKAEIAIILYKDQIKYIREEGKWPTGFCNEEDTGAGNNMIPDDMLPPSDSDSETENLGDMVINTNRPTVTYEETSSEEEDGDDDEGEGDEEEAGPM